MIIYKLIKLITFIFSIINSLFFNKWFKILKKIKIYNLIKLIVMYVKLKKR